MKKQLPIVCLTLFIAGSALAAKPGGAATALVTSGAGAAVIHEMLHTLGLPEHPYGYTTGQITDMVNQWCP